MSKNPTPANQSDPLATSQEEEQDDEQELTDEQYDQLYKRQVSQYNAKLAHIYEQDPSLKVQANCLMDHMIREGIIDEPATKKTKTSNVEEQVIANTTENK